jgi:hypothetical protein
MNTTPNIRELTSNVLLEPGGFERACGDVQQVSRIDRQVYLARLRREAESRSLSDARERLRLRPLLAKIELYLAQ